MPLRSIVLAVVSSVALAVPAAFPAAAQVAAGSAATSPRAADLVRVVDSVLATAPMDQLHWGILFRDLSTGEDVVRAGEARKYIPASNVKVPVTLAALELLGPDYRWNTALWSDAEVAADGTLEGDLVLPGTGDPTLSARFHPDDRAPLDSLAVRLARSGVQRVAGDLVVDVSRWDSLTVPGSWMVEDLGGWWGATPGAFAVAEGEVRIEAAPGPIGRPARLTAWPRALADTLLDVRITTVAPGADTDLETWYLPGSGRLVVRGQVEAGPPDTIRISAREPVEVAAGALADALREAGVEIGGGVRVVRDPAVSTTDACQFRSGVLGLGVEGPPAPGRTEVLRQRALRACEGVRCRDGDGPGAGCRPIRRRLAAVESPPLREVVRAVLEPSQNWIAEQLLMTLGVEALPDDSDLGWITPVPERARDWLLEPLPPRPGEDTDDRVDPRHAAPGTVDDPPSRRERALDLIERFVVHGVGVDPLDVRLRDASGLSTQNLLTPRSLVRMLESAEEAPWGADLLDALAAPGERESTLEHRLAGLEGSVVAKTGTLTNVVALSGFVRAADGRRLVFSVLVNGTGLPSRPVQRAVDRIVEAAAR